MFFDFQKKEYDYLLVPVRKKSQAHIAECFRRNYSPPYGYWPCLSPMWTHLAEVYVTVPDVCVTLEYLVFRTEYACLYAVTGLCGSYGRYSLGFMPSGVRDELYTC